MFTIRNPQLPPWSMPLLVTGSPPTSDRAMQSVFLVMDTIGEPDRKRPILISVPQPIRDKEIYIEAFPEKGSHHVCYGAPFEPLMNDRFWTFAGCGDQAETTHSCRWRTAGFGRFLPVTTGSRRPKLSRQNSPPNAAGSQFMITSSPLTSALPCR